MANRPLGVAVLGILGMLKGLLLIMLGFAMLLGGTLLGGLGLTFLSAVPSFLFAALFGLVGLSFLVAGFIFLAIYYWLYQMKKIGLWIVMFMEALSVIGGIFGLASNLHRESLFGILWSLIVLSYLWMRRDMFK